MNPRDWCDALGGDPRGMEPHECVEPFLQMLISDTDSMLEILPDVICDAIDYYDGEERDRAKELIKQFADTHRELERLPSGNVLDERSTSYILTFQRIANGAIASLGQDFFVLFYWSIRRYVEHYAADWLEHALAWKYGADKADRGDWEYEQRKDKLLEARE